MADHVRTQIRDRIVSLLQATSTAGANVLKNRVYDIDRIGGLPALAVSEGNETRTPVSAPAPRVMEVHSEYDVTVYAVDNTDCEKTLDDIAKEVEVALAMPVSGPWQSLTQIASAPQIDGDANKVFGRRVVRYRAVYLIRENAPDTRI